MKKKFLGLLMIISLISTTAVSATSSIFVDNYESVHADSDHWAYRDGNWMVADPDFHQAWNSRWVETNGKWYYVNERGKMVTNCYIFDNSNRGYYVGEDGAWTGEVTN